MLPSKFSWLRIISWTCGTNGAGFADPCSTNYQLLYYCWCVVNDLLRFLWFTKMDGWMDGWLFQTDNVGKIHNGLGPKRLVIVFQSRAQFNMIISFMEDDWNKTIFTLEKLKFQAFQQCKKKIWTINQLSKRIIY